MASSSGAVFGLAVRGNVRVHGLSPGSGTRERSVQLQRVARAEIEARCPRENGERLGGVGTGRSAVDLLSHGDAGFVWRAAGFGLFRVARDGGTIECAPSGRPAWRWQRMLIGQALPFAALTQGLEVLHAGAVAVPSGAVAFTGHSGAGKSTLVSALMRTGAEFLTDDVVAIEAGAQGIDVHPGPGVMSVRRGAQPPPDAVVTPVGEEEGGTRYVIRDAPRSPRPLIALLIIDRRATEGSFRIEALPPGDPRPVLAATFNLALRTPERLLRQLDVSARLVATTPVARLVVPGTSSPDQVAQAIRSEFG